MKPALTVKQTAGSLNIDEGKVCHIDQAVKVPAFRVSKFWQFMGEYICRLSGERKQATAFAVEDERGVCKVLIKPAITTTGEV